MSVYSDFLESVDIHKSYKINFAKGIVRSGKTTFVDNFKFDGNLGIDKVSIEECENLFEEYRHSIPSLISDRQKPMYKALTLDELSDEDLIYGKNRLLAQANFEFYLMAMIINEWKYPENAGYFYKVNDNLVLLREMFIRNNK